MTTQSQKKILIIEDERPMARALDLKLKHAGFQTQVVFNGKEGADLIQKGEIYDLILCDLMMPEMDGFSFLEMLHEKGIITPVIILSNLSQEDDEKRAKSLGAKEFFVKSNTPIAFIIEKVIQFLK